MGDQWSENLRCHSCRQTGAATLSQAIDAYAPTVLTVTEHFRVVRTQYGPQFCCRDCSAQAVQ